jgi:hypothetical protein
LFSDAEELGLNGAALLQPSTIGQKLGLVLNFEARYFWTELHVNGNKWEMGGLVKEFAAANTTFQYQTH